MKHSVIFSVLLVLLASCVKSDAKQPDNAAASQDVGWPRQVHGDNTTLVYYQPQVDKWDNYKKLSGRLAFSMTQDGKQEILGVASFVCDTKTDKEARTTFLHDISYTDVRFPSLKADSAALMKKVFLGLMPNGTETISTDRILAYLDSKTQSSGKTVNVKNDPPHIFYSASPAVLLIVDGDPVLSPVDNTSLQFVVNTNWDLFMDKKSSLYYLLVEDTWLTAKDLKGPWAQTTTLPKDFSSLPSGQNFDEVKKRIPPHAGSGAPAIFYNSSPAELILTEGAPVYSKIQGTQLLYVSNTDNDLFLDEANKQFYILLSGRWFRSAQFGGPWTYAGNDLPKDFSEIPEDSPKGHILTSVPGTVQASDAVLLAQIPTTVVVNKAEAEAKAQATYDGDPKFADIPGTSLKYATNTQEKVIEVGDLYYMCFQAIWFVSSSPKGPWKTADSVPSEIYTIPASSPVYNVTYVTQTNATETTVESSSTAGYFGAFIIGATVGAIFDAAIVYGTGWYYPPYVYWPPYAGYPIYRPWPCTYGAGAVYNPWTGGWAVGRAAYGPYGSAGSAAWYNPATGRYGRAASVQGWYGGRTAASSYNPWTGTYGHTAQGHNPYSQWGHSTVTNGHQWASSSHVITHNGSAFTYHTSGGKSGAIVNGPNGTHVYNNNGNRVYAGQDGNVYRKNDNGSWSRYDNNQHQWKESNLSGETRNNNLSGATRNTNLEGATRNANLGGATRNNLGGEGSVQHDLNFSDQSRLRGEHQFQQFNGFQQRAPHAGMMRMRR